MLPSSTSSSERTRSGLAVLLTLAGLAGAGRLPVPEPTSNVAGERVAYRVEIHELDPRFVADAGPRSRHASNGQGLRGDPIVGRDIELLVLGGSTVECSLLDEPDALVARIAASARTKLDGATLRAAALAQGGLPLVGLLPELEAFTSDERRPSVIIGMFGANEAQAFFNHAPWVSRGPGLPWDAWIDPASPFGVRGREETYRGWYRPGSGGRFLDAPRRAYADSTSWVEQLHPGHVSILRDALGDYVASLKALALLAERRDATLVLVTQPLSPWAPPAEGRGWAPFIYAAEGEGFVPSPELTRLLVAAFNAQTRGFAAEHGIALVDLAAQLEGCSACFYDQWHFANTGAARAGEAIGSRVAELVDAPHVARW